MKTPRKTSKALFEGFDEKECRTLQVFSGRQTLANLLGAIVAAPDGRALALKYDPDTGNSVPIGRFATVKEALATFGDPKAKVVRWLRADNHIKSLLVPNRTR
jgi:hypothetical protein